MTTTTPLDSPADHYLDVTIADLVRRRVPRAQVEHELMVASAVAEGLGERWTA